MKTKSIVLLFLITMSELSFSGGYTNAGIPTQIDIVKNEGMVIHGAFGNAAGCDAQSNNKFFVPASHTQYDALLSSFLAAKISKESVRAYLHTCTNIGWYGYSFGTLTTSGTANFL